jgi:hypothetical protein
VDPAPGSGAAEPGRLGDTIGGVERFAFNVPVAVGYIWFVP